ncbi:biosynthetic arginine decarboxylase [Pseudobacteriovorax antillogorgiicola]|uniref:Arginine decarboxylase n=1 Tax=Pseudobacteriovorax antillogorgiicola TaxID=1513793 RepID=A0A1Y6B8J2_9BACT|nr:biosynthetic arginine decarboxylase [Pseudobacteriovorax antillogorgiicola]TCS58595.1 arginine decarboxylase [Pseudobacteriovorax antillogorgiicola]SME97070.1 arginine decarboxylase [Pseudobacteriovorax antillogorgiicola]
MNIQQIQEAREQYGIEGWGSGYFGIDDNGNVVCHPTGEEHLSIDLPDLVEQAKENGISAPMILRFPQIIENQIARLHHAFKEAVWEYSYEGGHRAVFPFKVNQRREFIDHIVRCGSDYHYGLEVGSKPELLAAMSYNLSEKALFICNGFKDREFIETGFIAKAMGKNVVLVVEGPDELSHIIDLAKENPALCPDIGIRAKLYSRGSGKWAKSSGESSKFGLTTVEVLHCMSLLKSAGMEDRLQMLHFHIGSQVTEIKRIKNAIKEASRVFAKVTHMGFSPQFLNIGGGVGVDYDGSKTSYQSSANYSLQELANDVVYEIGEVCKREKIQAPQIVTESGRVIAAYHSIVVADIREVQSTESFSAAEGFELDFNENTNHKSLGELKYIIENINRKNYIEYYHDSIEYYEEMFTLFNLGYVNLEERALAEQMFYRICRRALYFSSFEKHVPEEFESLQQRMVSKFLANFSIFQSIPDAWSIDQLFPVMPLSHHEQKPTHKATIVDITCDSDGCLERFIDRKDFRQTLDLHSPSDRPYYLGFFLVGAYQESLANEHNLFGAINEAEVYIDEKGDWEIRKTTIGDPIEELLNTRNYDTPEILTSLSKQLESAFSEGKLPGDVKDSYQSRLEVMMAGSPYLRESNKNKYL